MKIVKRNNKYYYINELQLQLNMTTVGNPIVDNNGIASNFSDFNYFTWDVTQYDLSNATIWEIQTKMFVESSEILSSEVSFIFNSIADQRNFRFGIQTIDKSILLVSDGTSWINTSDFELSISNINNRWVWFKFGYDNSKYYYISYSFDGINYTKSQRYYSTYKVDCSTLETIGKPNRATSSSTIREYKIDLKETKLIKDNTILWTAVTQLNNYYGIKTY